MFDFLILEHLFLSFASLWMYNGPFPRFFLHIGINKNRDTMWGCHWSISGKLSEGVVLHLQYVFFQICLVGLYFSDSQFSMFHSVGSVELDLNLVTCYTKQVHLTFASLETLLFSFSKVLRIIAYVNLNSSSQVFEWRQQVYIAVALNVYRSVDEMYLTCNIEVYTTTDHNVSINMINFLYCCITEYMLGDLDSNWL